MIALDRYSSKLRTTQQLTIICNGPFIRYFSVWPNDTSGCEQEQLYSDLTSSNSLVICWNK
jgi:hypothetical protein